MFADVKPQEGASSVSGFPKIDSARIFRDNVHNFNFTWETSKNTAPGYYDITMKSTVTDTKCDQDTDIPVEKTMTVYVAESFDTCRADIKNFRIDGDVTINQPIKFKGEKLTVFQDWSHTGTNCDIKGTLVGGELLDSAYILTITSEDTGDVVHTETKPLPVNTDYEDYRNFDIDWTADVAGNYVAQIEVTVIDSDNKCGAAGTYSSASTTFNIGVDNDLDGYFYINGESCSNCDCNDDDTKGGSLINPGMPEICDGIDNNCDGNEDEDGACDEVHSYCDEDFDKEFSNKPKRVCIKSVPGCKVLTDCQDTPGTDCNDDNNKINSDVTEKCENDIDDNCNTLIDCADSQCTNFFKELFNYYPCKYVNNLEYCPVNYHDLNKTNPDCEYQCSVTGGEVCDGKDNDCDGDIDEDVLITYFEDKDADGFGLQNKTYEACDQPANYAKVFGDCDDNIGTNNPDADEICDNIDNNCDGQTDEGCACSFGDKIKCKSAGVCSDYELLCGLDGFVPECDYSDIENYETIETICDGLNNDCDVDSEGNSLVDEIASCCNPSISPQRACRNDPDCPGTKGFESCTDFVWSGECKATCPSDEPITGNSIDIIYPADGQKYIITDESENKRIQYEYDGTNHCQFKFNNGLYKGLLDSSTIVLVEGSHDLVVKCGDDVAESKFSVKRKVPNPVVITFDPDIFEDNEVPKEIVDKAKDTQGMFETKTSYTFEDGATIIKHSFIPDGTLSDASLYLHIPKCLANYTSEIEWETEFDEIILDDPLIAWHFVDIDDRIDLSYKVHGDLPDEECLKKLKVMGLADLVEEEEPIGIQVIIAPIIVVILVSLGAIIHQRMNKNMEKPLELSAQKNPVAEEQSEQNSIKTGMYQILKQIRSMKFKDKLEAYNYMKNIGLSSEEIDWIIDNL